MNKEQIIKELAEKYNLDELDITRLNTEAEVVHLRVEFAVYKAREEDKPVYDSLVKYAGLKLLTKDLPESEASDLEERLRAISITDVDEAVIDEVSFDLFEKSINTRNICNHHRPESCFRYTIWSDGKGAILHFANAVVPKNPFKGDEYEKRKQELREIAKDIKEKHPEVTYLFGVSWVRNLDVYQSLLPPETETEEYEEKEQYSMGHWGQFYRYDGNLNQKRIDQFKKTWKFPLKVLVGECDIKHFFKMYLE